METRTENGRSTRRPVLASSWDATCEALAQSLHVTGDDLDVRDFDPEELPAPPVPGCAWPAETGAAARRQPRSWGSREGRQGREGSGCGPESGSGAGGRSVRGAGRASARGRARVARGRVRGEAAAPERERRAPGPGGLGAGDLATAIQTRPPGSVLSAPEARAEPEPASLPPTAAPCRPV